MSIITDVVTELSVANESSSSAGICTSTIGQLPGAAVRNNRGSPAAGTPAGDAPDARPAAVFSVLQTEDMRKSLRDMEKHVCSPHSSYFTNDFSPYLCGKVENFVNE